MTRLRSNTISGLPGTSNYQGSIYASGAGAYLLTKTTAPGTDDFTIEFWINSNDASSGSQEGVFGINAQAGGFQGGTGNQIRLSQGRYGGGGTNGGLEVDINGTSVGTGNGNDIIQEGKYEGIIYQYGQVSVAEGEDENGNMPLSFKYNIIEYNGHEQEDLNKSIEFINSLVLSKAYISKGFSDV